MKQSFFFVEMTNILLHALINMYGESGVLLLIQAIEFGSIQLSNGDVTRTRTGYYLFISCERVVAVNSLFRFNRQNTLILAHSNTVHCKCCNMDAGCSAVFDEFFFQYMYSRSCAESIVRCQKCYLFFCNFVFIPFGSLTPTHYA